MSFVRSKYVNGYGPYYEEVEAYWVPGEGPKQRVLKYLGRNPGRSSGNNGSGPSTSEDPDGASGHNNDSQGHSTDLQDEKQETRDEIDESERRAREITARNEAEREIADTSDAPESRKEAVKRRRTEKAAKELKAAKDKAQKSLDDYHKDELEASKRSHEKWSSQRKKEAREVANRVGCSTIQADALNQRAKRAGQSYDSVDWDQIQGKDLTYHERVGKLDSTMGTRTRTKGDVARGARDFDGTVSKWEADPDRYQSEMESASRAYFESMKAEAY